MSNRFRGSVACLAVDDVDEAVRYYDRFFGFRLVSLSENRTAATVRLGDTGILLRRAEPSELRQPGADRPSDAWDAILPVDDFDATYDELSVRGVSLQTPVLEHPLLGQTFTVEDRFGNLLCFSPSRVRRRAALARQVRATRSRWRSDRFVRSAVAELRPHRERFERFYNQLADKRDIFYMFFTGGLLHWAVKAESFVPPDVNLVLVGSHLSTEERDWIDTNLKRPFHHVDLLVNDWPVWDWLLATNRHNFGWLDIDCLVLNSDIFQEMTVMPADASVNCLWSYDSGYDCRIANTYCVFLNVEAIHALRGRGVPVWARPHDWRGGDRSEQAGMRCFYRVPGTRERRLLLQVASPDGQGRPNAPGSRNFFDTLSIYQIMAQALGYRAHQVRGLENPMLGPIIPGEPRELRPQEMSDELIHVGGISYYSEHFHNPEVRIRYLEADYLTLRDLAPHLPSQYREQCGSVADELRAFGVEPDNAEADLLQYLREVGGLSEAAGRRALTTAWAPRSA